MNRRDFFRSAIAGAILGLARNLPMPAIPAVPVCYRWRAAQFVQDIRKAARAANIDVGSLAER